MAVVSLTSLSYLLSVNLGGHVAEGVRSDAPNCCSKVIKVRSSSVMLAGTLPLPVLRHLPQRLTSLRSPCCEEAQATQRGHTVGVQAQLWPTRIIQIQMPDKGADKSLSYSSLQSRESVPLRSQTL